MSIVWEMIVPASLLLVSMTQEGQPLRVRAQVPDRTYHVGQGIELRVGVSAAGPDVPSIEAPTIEGVTVAPMAPSFQPRSAQGIGSQTSESGLFILRFRLIPKVAGTLVVPPLRVRLGDRQGTTAPVRVEVRAPPASGRPATFLGGIGAFDVEADATAPTVRTGEAFTFRVRLSGPGTRGVDRTPDLGGASTAAAGLEITPERSEVSYDPPSRVLTYRVRPTQSGDITLPPVRVSAFDPETQRYITKTTSGVRVRVTDVPRFDPAQLEYAANPLSNAETSTRSLPFAVLTILGLGGLVSWTWRLRQANPFAQAARELRRVRPDHDPQKLAQEIVSALESALAKLTERPVAVLTPDEVRRGLTELDIAPGLVGRVAELVEACDRVRFGPGDGKPTNLDMDVLAALARDVGRRKRRGPRDRLRGPDLPDPVDPT